MHKSLTKKNKPPLPLFSASIKKKKYTCRVGIFSKSTNEKNKTRRRQPLSVKQQKLQMPQSIILEKSITANRNLAHDSTVLCKTESNNPESNNPLIPNMQRIGSQIYICNNPRKTKICLVPDKNTTLAKQRVSKGIGKLQKPNAVL
jgi:hypothetical protein